MENKNLIKMLLSSFAIMYILMYSMVDKYENIYNSLNQFFMASLMTSAMLMIEIWAMKQMYDKNTQKKMFLLGLVCFTLSYVFIRNQIGISDKDFLRSMISHHGSAILMCEKTKIKDGEIKKLCDSIISNQQTEIDWMRSKLSK